MILELSLFADSTRSFHLHEEHLSICIYADCLRYSQGKYARILYRLSLLFVTIFDHVKTFFDLSLLDDILELMN